MIKLARTLALPLALVLAVGVGACDKGKKGGGGGGATGLAGASAIAPAQGGLKRALAAMPADTDVIVGLDVAQLRKSDLWKKYEPMVLAKAGKKLEEIKAECGFDPIAKLTGVLIGGKGQQFEDATMFIRGFEKGPLLDCLKKHAEKSKAEADGKGKTVTVDGDYVQLTEEGDEPFGFLFIDDQTILAIKKGEGSADKAALQAAAAAKDGDGLTSSKSFVSLLDNTRTGAALWFLAKGKGPMFATVPGPMQFKAMFGSVNVGAGIDGEVRMRMDSKDGASSMKTMAEMGMEQAKGLPGAGDIIKGLKLSTSGEDVIIAFKYDQASLEQIAKMAQSMGGGF